jgi:ABC-type oligopeptide transport system ATPase subunit
MKKTSIIICLALTLQGCAYFTATDTEGTEQGDETKVFDSRLGPDTKDLLKTLPKTLEGDKKNARHIKDGKKPESNGNN